ncbi:MAG: GAF domain-containing protein, partial [Desulfobulbaceae bacterium]|nr:GAF domain-containing protein [Desulfobulbaceae bacterium]
FEAISHAEGVEAERLARLVRDQKLPNFEKMLRAIGDGSTAEGLLPMDTGHYDSALSAYAELVSEWQKSFRPALLQVSAVILSSEAGEKEERPLTNLHAILSQELKTYIERLDRFSSMMVDNYTAELHHHNIILFVFLVVVMALLGGIAVVVRRCFVQPIKDLAQAAQAVTAGDLSVAVTVNSRDELSGLATNFNGMTAAISDSLRDNARLLQRFKSLSRTIGLVLSVTEIETLLRDIAEEACRLVGARYGAVGIRDQHGGYEYFIHTGLSSDVLAELREKYGLPQNRGLLREIFNVDHPLRVADIAAHPSAIGFPAGHPVMRTYLGVPVRLQGLTIGAIYLVDRTDGEPFSEADEELISALANGTALAINNVRVMTKLTERNQELDILNRMAASTRKFENLETLLANILDEILTLKSLRLLKKGAIFLSDPKNQVLRMAVERNFGEPIKKSCREVPY